MTLTNPNSIQEEINSRRKSVNASYNSVQRIILRSLFFLYKREEYTEIQTQYAVKTQHFNFKTILKCFTQGLLTS
jgi:hypothetical protein